MKASEAFAAWCDGKLVQVLRSGDWHFVRDFELPARQGLSIRFHNGITEVFTNAVGLNYRLMPGQKDFS